MIRREFLAASLLTASALAAAAPAKRRVAVIGHTKRGDYGHSLDTLWQRLPEAEIVAVADADAAGLAKALERLNVKAGFADYKVMLREVKPEIVAVAPRHIDQHRDMILACVAAGVKGIYVEKSFCRWPAEADEIVAAVTKSNVKLAVAHRNRYHPVLPVVTKLLKDGALGKVLELRGRGKEDARGGGLDLWVLGSHVMNLATYFGGKPKTCSATLSLAGKPVVKADLRDGAEGVGPLAGDEAHARFEMERGMPYFFDSIKNAGVAAAGFGLQIIGTQGIIDLRVDTEPLAFIMEGNPFKPVNEPRTWVAISTAGVGQPEAIEKLGVEVASHTLAARDLIAAIDHDITPLCDANAAALTIEMIAAVFESHRLNGQRVTLPLSTRVNPLTLLP